ncbi:MAG: FIG00544011: hypothetical protein, partial [uncultured Actinomycetospora sp.]
DRRLQRGPLRCRCGRVGGGGRVGLRGRRRRRPRRARVRPAARDLVDVHLGRGRVGRGHGRGAPRHRGGRALRLARLAGAQGRHPPRPHRPDRGEGRPRGGAPAGL